MFQRPVYQKAAQISLLSRVLGLFVYTDVFDISNINVEGIR